MIRVGTGHGREPTSLESANQHRPYTGRTIGIRGEVTAPLARHIEFQSYHEHEILTFYEGTGLQNDQFLMLPEQILSCRLSVYEKSHNIIRNRQNQSYDFFDSNFDSDF